MGDIDDSALQAASDNRILADFIDSKTSFIIGCASKTVKRYITKSDDEWSVALMAFSDSVKTYSENRGSFLPYAEKIIKNRLIDYCRSELKYKAEYLVSPDVFDCEPVEDDENAEIKAAVAEKLISHEDAYNPVKSVKYEIEAVTKVFKEYGFSFYDIANCSPKSVKTKEACKKAVLCLLGNNDLMNDMKVTKQLPIKKIQNDTKLPRKLIEHHRRYIIAAAEILSGEYPCLAEYVSFIRK